MGPSRIFRLFLALLPITGMAVNLGGQDRNPTPVVVREAQSSGTDAAMESFLPDKISGLSRLGNAKSYTKETLYELIDGHAEYYISAGFNNLVMGSYGRTGENVNHASLEIFIYDMVKNMQAFSVLNEESGGHLKGTSTEIFTNEDAQSVSFSCGRYFVRVLAYSKTIPVDEVQKEIRLRIGIKDQEIPEFSRFPNLGTALKTRYFKESYRGISFFSHVIEREYGTAGGKTTLALYLGNENDIRDTTESFIKYFKESKIDYIQSDLKGRKFYRVNDPYEGNWVLIPMSDSLFCLYGSFNDEIITKILDGKSAKGRIDP